MKASKSMEAELSILTFSKNIVDYQTMFLHSNSVHAIPSLSQIPHICGIWVVILHCTKRIPVYSRKLILC